MPPRALNPENFLPFPLDIVITPYRLSYLTYLTYLARFPPPFRLRQSQRKLGIVVSKLCVTTTIVRQDWAKLMKTLSLSREFYGEGRRKGDGEEKRMRPPQKQIFRPCKKGQGDRLIVTNTDPGLPNYKLMSRGNFGRGNKFLPLYHDLWMFTQSARQDARTV